MPPEGNLVKPASVYMNAEEVVEMAKSFVDLGIKKIRLTGGEPLIRKDAKAIISKLGELPVELGISTNGILLNDYFETFKEAGLNSINVSLDSLNGEKFQKMTFRNYFERILGNIESALDQGFDVKVNAVLIRGQNDNEIIDFINFTRDKDIELRFIEFMPFLGNDWDRSKCIPAAEIMELANDYYGEVNVNATPCEGITIHNRYQVKGFKGRFGIISTVSNPFCDSCNRIRLTADGKVRNCLFSTGELDLLKALRNKENLEPLISKNILNKKKQWGGRSRLEFENNKSTSRSMTSIGG
jgi:cyclic pyranopterin phosphate synthase